MRVRRKSGTMRSMRSLTALLVMALPCAAQQPEPPHRSTIAFGVLTRCHTFKDAAVGYAGEAPPEVHAFRLLLARDDAAAAFGDLLERAGSDAGKLYALCGLYYADPPRFTIEIEKWRGRSGTILRQVGCTGFDDSVARCIEDPRPNTARLRGPDDTVKGWVERTLKPDPDGPSYYTDIFGGGIPADLADRTGWGRDVELRSVDVLAGALRDGSLEERVKAAHELCWHGPRARVVQTELVRCFESHDPQLFRAALLALQSQSYWALDSLPLIYRALDDRRRPVEQISEGVMMLDWFASLVRTGDRVERPWFLRVEKLPRDPEEAASVFPLDDSEPLPESICTLDRLPGGAIQRLAAALRDPSDPSHESAFGVLALGGEPSLNLLKSSVQNRSFGARVDAADAIVWLARRHSKLRPTVDEIMRELDEDEDREVRRIALRWLAR